VAGGEWLEIARLGRVRGLRGELYAQGDQTPEWYLALPAVRIRLAGGAWFGAGEGVEARELKIAAARTYSGRLALQFAGIESATEAGALVSGRVYLDRQARPAAPAGEFWLSDLVGCAVVNARDGRPVGSVTAWQEFGGPSVTLEVTPEAGGEPVLIPFVQSICVAVDPRERVIRIDPPEGLLDLNAGPAGETAAERE